MAYLELWFLHILDYFFFFRFLVNRNRSACGGGVRHEAIHVQIYKLPRDSSLIVRIYIQLSIREGTHME